MYYSLKLNWFLSSVYSGHGGLNEFMTFSICFRTVYPLYCNNSFNYSQDCNTPGSDFSSRKFSFSFAAPPSLFNPLDSRVAADRNVITAVSRITTPYVKNTALPSPTGGPIIKGTIGSISTYLSYSTTKASPAALQNDLSSSTTDLGRLSIGTSVCLSIACL